MSLGFSEIQRPGEARRVLVSDDNLPSPAVLIGIVINENGNMCIADVDHAMNNRTDPTIRRGIYTRDLSPPKMDFSIYDAIQ